MENRIIELAERLSAVLDHPWPETVATAEELSSAIAEICKLENTPLTSELLERNGFRYEPDYGSYNRSILGDYAKEKEPFVVIQWNAQGWFGLNTGWEVVEWREI